MTRRIRPFAVGLTPRRTANLICIYDTLATCTPENIRDTSTDDNVSKIYMYMYISQYESRIWKKYIPSKSHISTHASSREKEREREIYVDVRCICIILENIAFRVEEASLRKLNSLLPKGARAYHFPWQIPSKRKLLAWHFRMRARDAVYTSWKLIRSYAVTAGVSAELQTVDIHLKNAMLDTTATLDIV